MSLLGGWLYVLLVLVAVVTGVVLLLLVALLYVVAVAVVVVLLLSVLGVVVHFAQRGLLVTDLVHAASENAGWVRWMMQQQLQWQE